MTTQDNKTKAALYARRSPEDKANRTNSFCGETVSDSIESQMLLLRQYAATQNLTACREYFDDNISGTTFIREDFQRLLADIEQGLINCVIVKDLSRLGRDYIESGRYQEVVFPEYSTRLIAINDGYDSATGAGTDMAVFKNVFNDYYVKDISNKTRSALHARATAGKCLSAGVYGYKKDPDDKNKLLPDPETAPMVQRIFSMTASGYSFRSIASTLTNEGVLTPAAVKHLPPRSCYSSLTDWSTTTIRDIVRNQQYMGKLVYGKTKKISYKSSKIVSVPESEQIVVDNVFEPLVSQETWDLANELAQRRTKSTKNAPPHLFAGLLRCADCGATITLSSHQFLVCRRYKEYNRSEAGCTSHRIAFDSLYATVLASMQEITETARENRETLIGRLSGIGYQRQKSLLNTAAKERQRMEMRLAELVTLVKKAFEKNVHGVLSDEVFKQLTDEYAIERTDLTTRLQALVETTDKLTQETGNAESFVALVEQYIDAKELDRDLVHQLIDKIEIGQSYLDAGVKYQTIDIYYRFVGKV